MRRRLATAMRMARGQHFGLASDVEQLRSLALELNHRVMWLERQVAGEAVERLWAVVHQHQAWAASAPLIDTPRISVILATRNRHAHLPAAIDSVFAQTYSNWELCVVDDASTDGTGAYLDGIADERVVVLCGPGRGAAAARNVGLAAARGDVVTFLDDDNTMAAGWLRAVAEVMARRIDVEVLYGALIRQMEDAPHTFELCFRPEHDPQELRRNNYIDLGVLAVRRSHAELHFDERQAVLIDWEMILRLCAVTPEFMPLAVIAGMYTTSAPNRISYHPDKPAEMAKLRGHEETSEQ